MLCAGLNSTGCNKPASPSLQKIYGDASLKLKRGELTAALAEVEKVSLPQSPETSEWQWRFRNLKAEILLHQGSYKESLAILDADPPSSLAATDIPIHRRMTQGAACAYLERFADADRFLAEAESLARTTHPDLLADITLRKGTVDFFRDDPSAAQTEYRTALGLARESKDEFLEAAALGSMGLIATQLDHYDESIDWNRAALQLAESVGAQSSVARIQGNMGWSYFRMGDFEQALELYKRAEQASAQAGLSGDRGHWLTNIGNSFFELRNYASAETTWLQALELARSQDDKLEVIRCLNNLSLLALMAKKIDLAARYNKEASQLEAGIHDQLRVLYSKVVAGRIDLAQRDFDGAEALFKKVIQDPATEAPLRWEAHARLAEMYQERGRAAAADHAFRECLETIEKARPTHQPEELRLSFLSSAITFYNEYIDFLLSKGRIEDALQVAELSRARTLAEGLASGSKNLTYPLPDFHPQEIARRLGTTILFYWLGENDSHLWAITRRGATLFSLPPAGEIDSLVSSYRQALAGPRDVLESDNPAGKKLYEILIGPAKELVREGARVAVLPDGSLYGLNFEALVVPTPQPHFWIEEVQVTNANSLLLLSASVSHPSARSRNLLLVGDPVSSSEEYPQLPQASNEIADVEKYFDAADRKVLSGSAATPAAYLASEPGQYAFVHFVAHGTASRTTPLDSAVILTKKGDSYKLYARDILKEPLHAELVTISACHGAGERTFSGEGLVGLTWAFLRAGAHGVVAALWEVNDASTPQLMDRLYAGISKGKAADASLREAKLTLLHSGTVYRKPFYWAPFEYYRGS